MSFKCFISLAIDQSLKNELRRLIRDFDRSDAFSDSNIRWVNPDSMHMTLKFLGKVEDRDVPEICIALTKAIESIPSFEYQVNGLGTYPETGAARVVWAAVDEGQEALAEFADTIDQAMNKIGFMLENRKFSGHITLARIKDRKTGHYINEHKEDMPDYSPCQQIASRIELLQTGRSRDGVEYTTMHHIILQPLS